MRWLFILVLALPLLAQPRQGDGDDNSCWGAQKPCQDGIYRDNQGRPQPASCDNNSTTAPEHKCHCVIADTDADHCPPEGRPNRAHQMGSMCQTYCRDEACTCVNQCDFDGSAAPAKPAPKPAPKKGKK